MAQEQEEIIIIEEADAAGERKTLPEQTEQLSSKEPV